jgi:DNA-binding CsgD family transcriptional regulator
MGREAREGGGFAFRLPPERLIRFNTLGTAGAKRDAAVFLRALDALDEGLAFFTCAGVLLHANLALTKAMDTGLDGDRLRTEVEHFATSLCSLVRMRAMGEHGGVEELSVREIPLGNEKYRLNGSHIGLDLFGQGSSVLVTLERPAPDPLSDEVLRTRFGLSKQQSRILRLVVEGDSGRQIAQKLFLSPHTVRHHTERIFQKLQVRSRAEIAGRVLRG